MSDLSDAEQALVFQMKAVGLPQPVREYRFDPIRMWRFDFAFLDLRIAVEVEGGTWMKKAHHSHGRGFEDDCEKYAEAAIAGWRVVRFTTEMVEDGRAVALIERLVARAQGGFAQ